MIYLIIAGKLQIGLPTALPDTAPGGCDGHGGRPDRHGMWGKSGNGHQGPVRGRRREYNFMSRQLEKMYKDIFTGKGVIPYEPIPGFNPKSEAPACKFEVKFKSVGKFGKFVS